MQWGKSGRVASFCDKERPFPDNKNYELWVKFEKRENNYINVDSNTFTSVKRSKIARRVPFFTRMEFVEGTSISFTNSFNECESETKALRIFS